MLCNGPAGMFTEVNSTGTTVWKYINPISQSGVMTQGITPTQNLVFRCSFYANNYSGFAGHTLTSGNTIENSNTVSASCSLTLATIEHNLADAIKIYPNPAKDYITISWDNLELNNASISLLNNLGQIVFEKSINSNNDSISVNELADGMYYLKINSNNRIITKKVIISK